MDQQHPFLDDFEADDNKFNDDEEEHNDLEALEHPIFRDIYDDDLEAVQQHVLADGAVLEQRTSVGSRRP